MTIVKLTNTHGYFHTTTDNLDKWVDILATYSLEKLTALLDEVGGYYAGYYSDVTSRMEALIMFCDTYPEDEYTPSKDELMKQYNKA